MVVYCIISYIRGFNLRLPLQSTEQNPTMRRFYVALFLALAATAAVSGQEPEDTVKPKEVCEQDAEQCLSAP